MSVVGTRENNKDIMRGYEQDAMAPFAEAFVNVAKAGIDEGCNFFGDTSDFLRNRSTRDELKKFFMEQSFDKEDPRFCQEGKNANPNAAANIKEHMDEMSALFENDVEKIMTEASPLGAFNNVVGLALPIHKNILMSAVFDQILPKSVAQSPKFTLSLETREMIDIHGNHIDMFMEQNKMTPAINESVPNQDVIIPIPEMKSVNILKDTFNLVGQKYHLSIKSAVTGIIVESMCKTGDTYYDATTKTMKQVAAAADEGMKPVLFECGEIQFLPGYGEIDRQINKTIGFTITKADGTTVPVTGVLAGGAYKDDTFYFTFTPSTAEAKVSAIRFHAVVDTTSAAFPTVRFEWAAKTDIFQIPEQPHVTVTVSPESVKDIQASYDVNQITKLMSMMQLALVHWKDDNILMDLDHSFKTMPASQKVTGAIDWAPPLQFLGTPKQWRMEMGMDQLDKYVTRMLQVLNDENMTILVVGRPEIIRNIVPQEYTYQAPSNIGPVQLDYTRTVVSTDKRVYNFVSSQKMRNDNNLILMLIPRNTMRITYKLIDYQLYVSNEIRDTVNYELPGMTCFERWLFLQYQPVQGRIQIMNVMGTREQIENNNPVADRAMHDDTANYNSYASSVNGVVKTSDGSFIGVAKTATPAAAHENKAVVGNPTGYAAPDQH